MDLSQYSDEELQAIAAGGAKLPPAEATAPADKSYRGTILPVSRDQAGNVRFDISAGIPGMVGQAVKGAWSGFTYPGDVAAGRASPDETGRVLETATLGLPTLAPSRVGEPGMSSLIGARMAKKVPTATQLKTSADKQYETMRGMGVDYSPTAVKNVFDELEADLFAKGAWEETAPGTFALIRKFQTIPKTGPGERAVVSIQGLDALRSALGEYAIKPGKDGFAASRAIAAIDRFLGGPPEGGVLAGPASAAARVAEAARGDIASAKRSNKITGELDKATTGILERAEGRGEASFSGLNLDNPIRQRVESLLENREALVGFSPEEIAALEAVRRGGPVRNLSRRLGNLLGGGGGIGQSWLAAIGAAGGAASGEPTLAALGAATPFVLGTGSRQVANALAKRSLTKADELIRKRSPLYESGGAGMYLPGTEGRAALLRALLLSKQQQTP